MVYLKKYSAGISIIISLNPGWIDYIPGNKSQLAVRFQQALGKAGVHFYGLAPVYFNDVLVGILEVGAGEGVPPLNDNQYRKLLPVMPYVSQLLKLSIERFNISIDRIVKERFTVIQPSVQWKFNQPPGIIFAAMILNTRILLLTRSVLKMYTRCMGRLISAILPWKEIKR